MRLVLASAAFLAVATTFEQAPAFELSSPEPLAEAAIATELTSIEGEPVGLEDYRGQVVVLNFWATWCAPCRREMPSVARLQTHFEDQPLIVLAIAVDRAAPEKLQAFMADVDAGNLTVLRDTSMASMKSYALRGLPTTIVLDTNGKQVARHDGYDEWDRPEILAALETLLATN